MEEISFFEGMMHRNAISHTREYIQKGDIVLALFMGAKYFPAYIFEIHDKGDVSIEWGDGDQRDKKKQMSEIIFQDRPDSNSSPEIFLIGEYAEAYSKSSGNFQHCIILGIQDRTIRIKWVLSNDGTSNETSKPVCLVRKIMNSYPIHSEFTSYESVLALDTQQMTWRHATILKIVRNDVYKIAWEKSQHQGECRTLASIHSHNDNIMKHVSHLVQLPEERIKKFGYIYSTFGHVDTFGLPKQAMLLYSRDYAAAGGLDSGLTRPPNTSRSDPATFFADSVRLLQNSEQRWEDEIPSQYSYHSLFENKSIVEPYIFSNDVDGFEKLWETFQPGDYIQKLSSRFKGTEAWSEEVCIHQRRNHPRKEFIYLRVQSESGEKNTFKLTYKVSQRAVKLRKWVGKSWCNKQRKTEMQCTSFSASVLGNNRNMEKESLHHVSKNDSTAMHRNNH
jgi:hypothetical protein